MPRLSASSSSPSTQTSWPFLPDDDGGAGVLARRQDHARRDVGVLHQLEGDEAVVVRRLGILENLGELLEVARAEEMGDIPNRLGGQRDQRLGIHLQDLPAIDLDGFDEVALDAAVFRVIRSEFEHLLEVKIRHRSLSLALA